MDFNVPARSGFEIVGRIDIASTRRFNCWRSFCFEPDLLNRQRMAKNPPEWQKYKVGKPSAKSGRVNPDCQHLDYVYHVAHIPVAVEILRTGCLTPRLVYDKSKLNQRRI